MEVVSTNQEAEHSESSFFCMRKFVADYREIDIARCYPFHGEVRLDLLPPIYIPKFKFWACESFKKNADIDREDEIPKQPHPHNSGINGHMPTNGDASTGLSVPQQTSHGVNIALADTTSGNEVASHKLLCIDMQENEAEKEDAPHRDEDVVAIKNNPSEGHEDNVAQDDTRDGDGTGDNAKEISLTGATHEAGKTDSFETSPISMKIHRKRKRSTGSKNKNSHNKKTYSGRKFLTKKKQIRSDGSNSGASETVDVTDNKNEDVGTTTISGIEPPIVESNKTDSENSEVENVAAHRGNEGETQRKMQKTRSIGSIYTKIDLNKIEQTEPVADPTEPVADKNEPVIDQIEPVIDQIEPVPDHIALDIDKNGPVTDQIEPVTDQIVLAIDRFGPAIDQIEPDIDLAKIRPYIDLNLSPTHQGMGIQYEDDEELQFNLQMNVCKEVEEAAAVYQCAADKKVEEARAGNQHAADAKDQRLTSRKRKGKTLHYEEEQQSFKTSQGDISRGLQLNNENIRGQGTGAGSFSPKSRKDASTRRSLQSEIEAHNGEQRNDAKTIQTKDKTVNAQLIANKSPLIPSRKRSMPQVVNGSSSLGYQPEDPTTPRKAKIQKENFDQSPNKTSERAGSDEILEIAEMMAKNQHERCLGASENTNVLPGETTNKLIERTSMDEIEVLGSEIPRFLQEKKLQKQITQSRNAGNSNSGAKRVGSKRQTDPSGYNFQSRHNSVPSLPEQSHTSTRFNTFPQNQVKPTRTEFLGGNPSINYLNIMLSKNHDQASIRAQLLAENDRRKFDNQNFTNFVNREEPSSGAQFLTATSSGHCGDQITALSRNQEKPLNGAQVHNGSYSRLCHNQTSTFVGTCNKTPTRSQFLFDSSSKNSATQNTQWVGRFEGQRYSHSGFQTSGAYQTSQTTSWQNSSRNNRLALPPMMPNRFPLGISNSQKFAVESKTANKQSPSLELFPNESMNGDQSLTYRDPFANSLEKKRNFELETSNGIRPQYPFAQNERGVQLGKQPMQPVSFFNNETIPATHLLRLMEHPSSSPVNLEENQKYNQQPFLTHGGHQQQDLFRYGHPKRNEGLMLPPSSKSFDQIPPGNFSGNFVSVPKVNTASSSIQKKDTVPDVPESRGGHQQQDLSRYGHPKRNEGLMLPPSSKSFDKISPRNFSGNFAAVPKVNTASSSIQKKDTVPEVPESRGGHQQQDLSRYGHPKRNEGLMLPPSSKSFDKISPGNFSGNFASVPEVNTASSSIQKKDTVPEVPDSRGDSPAILMRTLPTGQAKGKGKIKEASTQSKSSTSSRNASGKDTWGKNETISISHLQKGLVFTPEPVSLSLHSTATKDSTKPVELEAKKTGTVSPQKIRKKEFCMINRNPADFTLPEEIGSHNVVGHGGPKLKENVSSKERTCRIEPVGNKRKKRVKPAAKGI